MSRTLELILGFVGVAMFVGMLLAVPWVLNRLPADHFVRPPPQHSVGTKIFRNIVGIALVAAGVAMLVLPGQGILSILFGLSFIDLPVKRRILCWLLRRPQIQRLVQNLRRKAGKPPLVIPTHV